MTAASSRTLLTAALETVLRGDGFRGSLPTLCRRAGDFHHVVNVQASA